MTTINYSSLLKVEYVRANEFKNTWTSLRKKARVSQHYCFKDLRSTSITFLRKLAGLTHLQACPVIRNTPKVNEEHYSRPMDSEIREKIDKFKLDLEPK